jgi:hypothetical protein
MILKDSPPRDLGSRESEKHYSLLLSSPSSLLKEPFDVGPEEVLDLAPQRPVVGFL